MNTGSSEDDEAVQTHYFINSHNVLMQEARRTPPVPGLLISHSWAQHLCRAAVCVFIFGQGLRKKFKENSKEKTPKP